MSWARSLLVLIFFLLPPAAFSQTIRILVVGQSISANCNQYKFPSYPGVYMVGVDGVEKLAIDPFINADCVGGAIWIPLGEKIIEEKIATKVVFYSVGIAGSSVRDWVPNARGYEKLISSSKNKPEVWNDFDFAFWLQGSSDVGAKKSEYISLLQNAVAAIDSKYRIGKWIFAIHSRCAGGWSKEVEAAQLEFGDNFKYRRYVGPDFSLIGSHMKFDGCHLNKEGQIFASNLWLSALKNSELHQKYYEYESMIKFFK